jgi:hypothetical protein
LSDPDGYIFSLTSLFNVKINKNNTETKEETAVFLDQMPAYTYEVDSTMDPTRMVADRDDATLDNFFSRPLKIRQYTWTQSSLFYEKFNPWTLYFDNPRVINRIANYNLLRAKLCVKIVINGNGFHFGRLIASYLPLHQNDFFTQDRSFFIQDVVGASQRPHVYLDPTLNQGGTLCLPFMWRENYLAIPTNDWEFMGNMVIHTMQQLKHANGATDPVTISVFAWATDVTMSIPTSAMPSGMAPQMDDKPVEPRKVESMDGKQRWHRSHPKYSTHYNDARFKYPPEPKRNPVPYTPQMADEYAGGPISQPASVVARIAGMLTEAPVIGPFAMATRMAASTVSNIAKLFGYSRPNNIANIGYFRPVPMGNLANANVMDTAQKLTFDCKQELTVDPRTVGLGAADEMSLKSIATRESFLTNFVWTPADPPEQCLFEIAVTPMVWSTLSTTSDTEIHMPACCFAALPFKHWYGSMRYRFQVVASNYHKGRLKVVFDPHGFASNEYNTNYTYIIDIAESKDFSIDIGWASDKPYCRVDAPGEGTIDEDDYPWAPGEVGFTPGNGANGVLRVYVVNELTTPNSTVDNSIEMNCFVATGDDIQFRNPSERLEFYSWFREPQFLDAPFTPQMADMPLQGDAEDTKEPSKPMQTETDVSFNNPVSLSDNYSQVFFGEEIVSIRQLLKRYCLHAMEVDMVTVQQNLMSLTQKAFPYYKGYAAGGIWSTTSPASRYNLSYMTYLNYFTPAFTGWRGGIRWKVNYSGAGKPGLSDGWLQATRTASLIGYEYTNTSIHPTLVGNAALTLWQNSITTVGGTAETSLRVCDTLEFEVPYYASERFSQAKSTNYTTTINAVPEFKIEALSAKGVLDGTTATTILRNHCAAGEDFSLFFFTGAPVIYYNVSDPVIVARLL